MKVAPLIFSRMLYVDFNQNFTVRPKDFDTAWGRSKINPTLREVGNLQGEIRRVVAKNGDICIAGITGNFEDFIKNYIPEMLKPETEKFFRESKGRKTKGFIGYVFKGEGVPAVSYKDLWRFFENNMSKIWERETPETIFVEYGNFDTESAVSQPSGSEKISDVICYGGGNDELIWKWCIAKKLDFCSNVNQYDILKDGKYKVIAASQSVINRWKDEAAEIRRKEEEERKRKEEEIQRKKEEERRKAEQKLREQQEKERRSTNTQAQKKNFASNYSAQYERQSQSYVNNSYSGNISSNSSGTDFSGNNFYDNEPRNGYGGTITIDELYYKIVKFISNYVVVDRNGKKLDFKQIMSLIMEKFYNPIRRK